MNEKNCELKIVSLNGINVGFYMIQLLSNKLILKYNLYKNYNVEKYQHDIVDVITNLVCTEFSEYENIYLWVNVNDIRKIMAIQKCGYKACLDNELYEKSDKKDNYILFSKNNLMYDLKTREKQKRLLHKI